MSIDGVGTNQPTQTQQTTDQSGGTETGDGDDGSRFGSVMSSIADGALSGVANVAPTLPGGELVGSAAEGLQGLKDAAPDQMPDARDEQLDQMFQMQEESQAFNLQYLELQNQMQQDNRQFETMSNLMKVRHDTAQSAINNMHV